MSWRMEKLRKPCVCQDGLDEMLITENAAFEASTSKAPDARMSRTQRLAFQVAFELAERNNVLEDEIPWTLDPLPDNLINRLWPRLVRYAVAGLSGQAVCNCLMRGAVHRKLLQRPKIAGHLLQALAQRCLREFVEALVRAYHAALGLCTRRYFQRRWVIQEIYQSRPGYMLLRWGSFATRVDEFMDRVPLMDSLANGAYDKLYNQDSWSQVIGQVVDDLRIQGALNVLSIRQIAQGKRRESRSGRSRRF